MKSRIVFFFCCLCTLFMDAQDKTKVELILNSTSQAIETISFFNFAQNVMFHEQAFRDSIQFEFPASSDDGYNIWYTNEQFNFRSTIWLGNAHTKVYVSLSDVTLKIDSVIGAPIHYEVLANLDSIKNIGEDKTRLDRFLMREIREHISSPYSIMLADNYLRKFPNDKKKLRKLKIIMDLQSPLVKNHWLYQGTYQRLLALLGVQQLKFEQYSLFDKNLDETYFTNGGNQYTVLDFWFSACRPCIKQHQEIKRDFEENKLGRQIRVVGISTDQNQIDWVEYLADHNLPWDNFLENNYIEPALSNELGIISFPTYVVIDKDNKILANFNSYQHLKDFIQKNK